MAKNPLNDQSIFGGGPPSVHGGGSDKKFIGVPKGYVPPYAPNVTPQFPKGHQYIGADGKAHSVKTRYQVGDEWAQVAGLAPEYLQQIQQSMAQAGFLTPGKFQSGAPDTATRKAITTMLTEANGLGMQWKDYLSERVQIAEANGGPAGPTRAPLEIQLSNPDTIKAAVTNDATSLLGSSAAAGDPNHYVGEIQDAERLQQTEAYNQTGSGYAGGTGGTTTDAPSVDALLMKEHPAEHQAFQLGQHGQEILNALTSVTPGGGDFRQ